MGSMKVQVIRLLKAGKTYNQIVDCAGCSKATISYHAKRLGLGHGPRKKHDWTAIRRHYEDGHSVRECAAKFGFNLATWSKAVQRGDAKGRPPGIPLEPLLVRGSHTHRSVVRRKLILEGKIKYECAECGMRPAWQRKPLSLVLDHINGIKNDHRRENLRFLCPNCNSQTDTFSGRNVKRNRSRVRQRQASRF